MQNQSDQDSPEKSPSQRFRFNLRTILWVVLIIAAGFLFLSCLGVGTSVQVRLDTGDQRECFWGIPVWYRPMLPEARKALLSLNDPQVPSRWVWCATQVGSNNADSMVFGFYHKASVWVEVNPEIAKLVIRDLANYMQTTHATHGLPDCHSMLWHGIVEDWEINENVQRYLTSREYKQPQ